MMMVNTVHRRQLIYFIVAICVSITSIMSSYAQQYKSRELAPTQSLQEKKSIATLEKEIRNNQLTNPYARQSTARYLARYYRQTSPEKALSFYRESLSGEGLSVYAKQELCLELISLYARLNNHQAVVDHVKKYITLGGKETVHLLLLEANALLLLGEKQQVLAVVNKAWMLAIKALPANKHTVNESLLLQFRFLYYRAGHIGRAAELQKYIVDKYDQSLAAIELLASLYLKQQRYQQAADVLHMAFLQKYTLTESAILQLTALYAKTLNPYMSATVLSKALEQGRVASSDKHQRQLMYYWLQAKEFKQAAKVLESISQQTNNSGDYLLLAELYQRQSQWQRMKLAVEQACRARLEDADIGRANVLLGIAELKLGANTEARRAFINATLQGGEIDRANQYLQFMRAKSIGQEELQSYQGVCTPQWAQAKDYSLAAPSHDEFFVEGTDSDSSYKAVTYTMETGVKQQLVGSFHSIAFDQLENELLPLIMRLGMYIGKNGGQINGDLHFIFSEPFTLSQEFLSFTLAFPVRKKPMMKGKIKLFQDEGFEAAVAIFEGHPDQLTPFWTNFYRTVIADSIKLSGESRQIVLEAKKASKDYIKMKLELGVAPSSEE